VLSRFRGGGIEYLIGPGSYVAGVFILLARSLKSKSLKCNIQSSSPVPLDFPILILFYYSPNISRPYKTFYVARTKNPFTHSKEELFIEQGKY